MPLYGKDSSLGTRICTIWGRTFCTLNILLTLSSSSGSNLDVELLLWLFVVWPIVPFTPDNIGIVEIANHRSSFSSMRKVASWRELSLLCCFALPSFIPDIATERVTTAANARPRLRRSLGAHRQSTPSKPRALRLCRRCLREPDPSRGKEISATLV